MQDRVKPCLTGILFLAFGSALPVTAQLPTTRLTNSIFVQTAGIPGAAAVKVNLIADAGFNGIMCEEASAQLPELLTTLQQRNKSMVGIWRNAHEDIAGDVKTLGTAGPYIFLYMPLSLYTTDAQAAAAAAAVADLVAPSGRKVAIYPHAPDYVSNSLDAAKIAKLANRPNLGISFNLCHELMYCNINHKNFAARFDSLTRLYMPYIMTASISGGDSVGDNWGVLIRPLGEGTFDVFPVVKKLMDRNFKGPFLLQAFGITQSPAVHLAKSMSVWQDFQKRLPAIYGCMDTNYKEFDPLANVSNPEACLTRLSTPVLEVSARKPGILDVTLFNVQGRELNLKSRSPRAAVVPLNKR